MFRMQRKTTFSILLNLYLIQISYGDVFTAQISMEKILHVEKALGNDIMSYIHKEETRLEKLRKIATEYTTHSTEKLRNPEDYLANALNAYLFIKKFTVGWNETEKLISETYTDEFLTIIDGKTSDLPTQEDLEGAALALLRLQDTYALPTEAVAKGNLYGVKQSPRLTAGDCWELGLVAYMRKDFYHAVLWLNQSLTVLDEEDTKTTSKARVLEYLSWATYKQGNIEHAYNLSMQCLEINPNNELVRINKDFWKKMMEDGQISDDKRQSSGIQNERNLDAYRKSEEFTHYEALCRGENVAEYKMAHKLTCQYRRHHPIFYLTPLKEEMLYFEPRILAYHDLITDSEIACIKKLATPKLRRATVKGVAGGPQQKAFYRVGKSGWLADSENPLILRVSTKIQHLSSLSLETAEMMQVVNYGIGGHYEPHFDWSSKEHEKYLKPHEGKRIATAICYLNEVVSGGFTVFPRVGVKVQPELRSCALWYNLKRNGQGDDKNKHAACPVLTGTKWVATKWIHERGNEFKRPCSLNPHE